MCGVEYCDCNVHLLLCLGYYGNHTVPSAAVCLAAVVSNQISFGQGPWKGRGRSLSTASQNLWQLLPNSHSVRAVLTEKAMFSQLGCE